MTLVRVAVLFILSLNLLACGALNVFIESSTSDSSQPAVVLDLSAANFIVAYDGQGQVNFNGSDIAISPKASTSAAETHAALVLVK